MGRMQKLGAGSNFLGKGKRFGKRINFENARTRGKALLGEGGEKKGKRTPRIKCFTTRGIGDTGGKGWRQITSGGRRRGRDLAAPIGNVHRPENTTEKGEESPKR